MKDFWKLKGDKVIWIIVVFFAMISVLAVFSSSSYLATSKGVAKTAIFFEQIKSVLLGFIALFFCYLIPLRFYRAFSFMLFGISVTLLLALFVPGLQDVKNGAIRGIKVFGHTVQVFEFAKIGVILYLAKALELWENNLYTFKDFALKILLPVGAVCFIVMMNSFSSALLIAMVTFLVLFFMDVRFKNLLITVGILFGAILVMFGIYHAFFANKPERQSSGIGKVFNRFGTVEGRFQDFISEKGDGTVELSEAERMIKEDEQRQSENAKIAISEGGLFGKGPGKSTQRYSLSMAFSDFIYAFIVEEYGLILGGIGVIVLYLVFLFRCIRLCVRCRQTYSSALVIGLSFLIICQAFLHILVNVRLIPITGHTLPLISHGGTAYLVLSAAFGMILSVNKQLDKQAMKEAEQQAMIDKNKEIENEQSTDNN